MIRRSPSRHARLKLLLLLALSAVLLPGCGAKRAPQGPSHPAIGQPFLLLDLQPLTGGGAPINKDSLKGRVTLMNFWATWCGPCKIEFPLMAAMAKKLSADPKFQYLSVNMDGAPGEQPTNVVENFLREQHADHPTWTDPSGATIGGLAHLLGKEDNDSISIPMTLVIDGTGTVRGIWIGYDRGYEKEMETLLSELLKSS